MPAPQGSGVAPPGTSAWTYLPLPRHSDRKARSVRRSPAACRWRICCYLESPARSRFRAIPSPRSTAFEGDDDDASTAGRRHLGDSRGGAAACSPQGRLHRCLNNRGVEPVRRPACLARDDGRCVAGVGMVELGGAHRGRHSALRVAASGSVGRPRLPARPCRRPVDGCLHCGEPSGAGSASCGAGIRGFGDSRTAVTLATGGGTDCC